LKSGSEATQDIQDESFSYVPLILQSAVICSIGVIRVPTIGSTSLVLGPPFTGFVSSFEPDQDRAVGTILFLLSSLPESKSFAFLRDLAALRQK
jgi:hypothetical protein